MLAESLSICSVSEGWLAGGAFSGLGVVWRGSKVSKIVMDMGQPTHCGFWVWVRVAIFKPTDPQQ